MVPRPRSPSKATSPESVALIKGVDEASVPDHLRVTGLDHVEPVAAITLLEGTAFLTLSDDTITEVRTVFDSLALAVQTGAAEAPTWWPGRS